MMKIERVKRTFFQKEKYSTKEIIRSKEINEADQASPANSIDLDDDGDDDDGSAVADEGQPWCCFRRRCCVHGGRLLFLFDLCLLLLLSPIG